LLQLQPKHGVYACDVFQRGGIALRQSAHAALKQREFLDGPSESRCCFRLGYFWALLQPKPIAKERNSP
jgi:hypothetical protein